MFLCSYIVYNNYCFGEHCFNAAFRHGATNHESFKSINAYNKKKWGKPS